MKDKPYKQMISALAPHAEKIIITSSFYKERSAPANILKIEAEKYCNDVEIIEDLPKIINKIDKLNNKKIYVTGSLYLVGAFKKLLSIL